MGFPKSSQLQPHQAPQKDEGNSRFKPDALAFNQLEDALVQPMPGQDAHDILRFWNEKDQ